MHDDLTRRAGASPPRAVKAYKQVVRHDPCSYCGAQPDTLDHIVPSSRGGESRWDNLTATCNLCNSRKHALSLLAFLGVRQLRAAPLPSATEVFDDLMATDEGRTELTTAWERLAVRGWRAVGAQ